MGATDPSYFDGGHRRNIIGTNTYGNGINDFCRAIAKQRNGYV